MSTKNMYFLGVCQNKTFESVLGLLLAHAFFQHAVRNTSETMESKVLRLPNLPAVSVLLMFCEMVCGKRYLIR
jgi:hypothetical protein